MPRINWMQPRERLKKDYFDLNLNVQEKRVCWKSVILKTIILKGEEMEALILCLTSPKYTALYQVHIVVVHENFHIQETQNIKVGLHLLQQADGLMDDEDEEIPTDDIIERMEERLEAAQNQQKRLFLIIFQVWRNLK